MILLDDKTFHAALAPIRSESIGDVWHMPVNVDGAWRNVEVVDVLNRLVAEYDKLRAEAKRADEEATKLANSNSTTPRPCAGCNRNLADVVRTIAFNFDDLKTGGWRFEVCGSTPDCSDRLMLKIVTDVRRSNEHLRVENERLRETLQALVDEKLVCNVREADGSYIDVSAWCRAALEKKP